MQSEERRPDLTVVIPSYNSAVWLPSTLSACAAALAASGWSAEVVVVDDGSTDDTVAVLDGIATAYPVPLRVVRQENQGRFLARWAGLQAARGERVLLLDSRVLLEPDGLAHVAAVLAEHPEKQVWNGHCVTDPAAPLVGHFWEVITYTAWGGYLGSPAPVEFGLADFNSYPKGTGVFLAPRDVLIAACEACWPTGNAALTSDDTKLIRYLAARSPVRLDPGFRAVYRPRGNVRDFVRHSFGRGTFLVDSFAGTAVGWNVILVGLAVLPVLGLAALAALAVVGAWAVALWLVVAAVLVVCAPAAVAGRRGCPARGVRAYLTFMAVFAVPYWGGLLRGLSEHGHLLRSTRRLTAVDLEAA